MGNGGLTASAMWPGQRTLGSQKIPSTQTEHFGSQSWRWWVKGGQGDGRRHWPDAPTNRFAALGHGGGRSVAVMPDLDLVAWNDGQTDTPAKVNEAFRRLVATVRKRD